MCLQVAADNSDEGRTLVQITDDGTNEGNGHQNGSPQWSPDGATICYSTSPTHPTTMWYATAHLAVAASNGSDAAKGGRVLTMALDRNMSGAEFSAAGTILLIWTVLRLFCDHFVADFGLLGRTGDCIYATMTDHGCTHLVSISLSGAEEEEVTRIIAGEVSVSSWEIVGSTTVTLLSTCNHPAEVFILEGAILFFVCDFFATVL